MPDSIAARVTRTLLCALGRAYPFVRGTGRLPESQFARRLVSEMTVPIPVRLRNGNRLYVTPADWDGRCVYFTGDQDRAISTLCRALLPAGSVAVDIGANCGVETHWCARAVGPSGAVHSFEPQSRLARTITQSLELNKIANVTLHNIALSDEDGSLELFVPTAHTGGASLDKRGHDGSVEIVRVARSGPYLEALGVSSVRLVKMDVEGHEAHVLAGMRDLLGRGAIDFVLFEVLPDRPDDTAAADEILRELGFAIFGVVKRLAGVALVPVAELDASTVVDCLAVRPGLDLGAQLGQVRMAWNARVEVSGRR